MRTTISIAKRIVIKVGTSTLTHENGKINLARLDKLAEVLSDLVNQGKQVILVSSGAIGVGVAKMKLSERPHLIRDRQAAAAVGQSELMHLYSKFFGEYGHIVAQILLTKDVLEKDILRSNVSNTFETLLEKEIIPIVNENDPVSTDEIIGDTSFGDNDTLSALVAHLLKADCLIILSDIDGFYSADPKKDKTAILVSEIEEVTPEVEAKAGGVGSNRGTGGMATKLKAAKLVNAQGIPLIIAQGSKPERLYNILQGEDVGTLFKGKSHE